jgi:hypothetical protein
VPPISELPDNKVIEIATTGGGRGTVTKIKRTKGEHKEIFDARVEPENPYVRDKASSLAVKYPGDKSIDQINSIFQYVKDGDFSTERWGYVGDVRGIDVYNYANESLRRGEKANRSGVGDCDDFAIVMSSLVESIGGTTRVILAHNDSGQRGHAFAEVYLGKGDQVEKIIDWLKKRYELNEVFTDVDTDTKEVWLNLDWWADHPGGTSGDQFTKHLRLKWKELHTLKLGRVQ